jgi:hypothetical protein
MAKEPPKPSGGFREDRGNDTQDQADQYASAHKSEDVYSWGSFVAAGLEQTIAKTCKPGDYVVVDIDTKDYVVGQSLSEAVGLFRRSFPHDRGYVFRFGEPLPISTI